MGHHRYWQTTVGLFICALMLAAAVLPAAADIGPASNANGSGIGPVGATQVRMEAERVEIAIQPAQNEIGGDGSFALVTADFSMRNLGASTETMRVKFPLNNGPVAAMSGDEIKDVRAWVGDQEAEITYGAEPFNLAENEGEYWVDTTWAYFAATFPVGELVPIRVQYVMQPVSADEEGQYYYYTLVTGRDWRGTIGRAEVLLILPYEANGQNIPQRRSGSRFADNQLVWVKNDFEPTGEDGFSAGIVPPAEWLAAQGSQAVLPVIPAEKWTNLLMAQMGLERYPEEWGSWLGYADANWDLAAALAKAGDYSSSARDYFADLATAAYQRSAELNPQQRAPAIGIAGMALFKGGGQVTADNREAILAEYQKALALPPSADEGLAEIEDQRLADIARALGVEYRPTTPTPSPTVTPLATDTRSPTKTITPAPTDTREPAEAPTHADPPADERGEHGPQNAGWLLGAGLVVVIAAWVVGVWARGRR